MAELADRERAEAAPVIPQAPKKAAARGRRTDMRAVHRAVSLVACLFLLWMGVTGSAIQLIDLATLFSRAPESDPTMQSINEGKFGNGYYSAVTLADWSGAALPTGTDIRDGFARTLAAFHRASPDVAPTFVELRVVGGRTVGQVAYPDANAPPDRRGGVVLGAQAFDLASGARVAPIDIRGASPVASPRQTLKEWHRFWGPTFIQRRDVPGVYIQLVVGVAMWVLIVTGLVMYFRLLKQRRKLNRPALFWLTGGVWRGLHRGVSVVAAILLLLVAASGTWLGFESSWHTFVSRAAPEQPARLADADVQRIAAAAFKAFRADEPQTPIKVIRARVTAGKAEGVIVTGGTVTRQRVFAADSGREMNLSEPHYPNSGFPFGMDVHEWVKHFHSGYLFGLPARMLDLLAGLSLVFLSVSGLWMYVDMWRKRRRAGRSALFWK